MLLRSKMHARSFPSKTYFDRFSHKSPCSTRALTHATPRWSLVKCDLRSKMYVRSFPVKLFLVVPVASLWRQSFDTRHSLLDALNRSHQICPYSCQKPFFPAALNPGFNASQSVRSPEPIDVANTVVFKP